MDLKRSFLIGLLCTSIAVNTSCRRINKEIQKVHDNYLMPWLDRTVRFEELMDSAIKSKNIKEYYRLREYKDEFSQITYDIKFVNVLPGLEEQLRLDEKWLNEQRGNNEADLLRAMLLYTTSRTDEAFEVAKSLESKIGFFDFVLRNKNNYLLGILHGQRGDWLTATEYFSKVEKGYYHPLSNKAKEILAKRGIIILKEIKFKRPMMKLVAEQYTGKIICPYYGQRDPFVFLIEYESSDLARKDFLRSTEILGFSNERYDIHSTLEVYDDEYFIRQGPNMFYSMIGSLPAVEARLIKGRYIEVKNCQKINERQAGQIAALISGFILGGLGEAPFPLAEPFIGISPLLEY